MLRTSTDGSKSVESNEPTQPMLFGAIRTLNRLETVGETMRATLNILATIASEWLCTILSPDWFDRYEKRCEAYRLPKGKAERQRYAEVVGEDGFSLL